MDRPETGTVTHVERVANGYCFVTPLLTAGRLFLHRYDYRGEWPPAPGTRVRYRVAEGQGRSPRAVDCEPSD
jgi:hypothetical protein